MISVPSAARKNTSGRITKMVQAKRTGFWTRSVCFSVAAIAAALFGAVTVTQAQCTNCTSFGTGALPDGSGPENSAFGFNALHSNDTGAANTATGSNALLSNTTGSSNTATGYRALTSNTTGSGNTATGWRALLNSTVDFSTATGFQALRENTTGTGNTATGSDALLNNTTGSHNSATGDAALAGNLTGGDNTATGWKALIANGTGENNTAIGSDALDFNSSGSNNIAVGQSAGANLSTGDNNIDIGNGGQNGESNTIRIGTAQTATFIAGIFGTPKIKKACQVVVEASGHVGCVKSSARYKRDIRDMGNASEKLMKLRPVTFRYKADSTDTQQYGLIAEEVEKVYPELVIEDTDGKAETIAYQVLPAMLLNELQKQSRELKQKDAQIATMQRQLAALQKKDREIDTLAKRLDALEYRNTATGPDLRAAALR